MGYFAEKYHDLAAFMAYASSLATVFLGFLSQYAAGFGVIFTGLTFATNYYFQSVRTKAELKRTSASQSPDEDGDPLER
ncbi:MAG: HP1 family phage holin [Methylovulum sp.]|nr:HP1 family phage holin [Methylovulum sp.]